MQLFDGHVSTWGDGCGRGEDVLSRQFLKLAQDYYEAKAAAHKSSERQKVKLQRILAKPFWPEGIVAVGE